MTFLLLPILIGLIVGWGKKGSIRGLSSLSLRLTWILPIAYVIQYVAIYYMSVDLYQGAMILSYLSIIYFCVYNHAFLGMKWLLAGTLSNFIVMAANHFRMPAYMPDVRAMDLHSVQRLQAGALGKSIAMTAHTHLNFLADIFAVKSFMPSLVSIGDILFAIGIVIAIQHAMQFERKNVLNVPISG